LVNQLPDEAKKLFADHPNHWTPAQWSFRWLWDQPEITVVLSGMNTEEMIADNVATACAAKPGHFTQPDQDLLKEVVKAFNAKVKVGCTGCGYCMPCPMGVDIPGTFNAYNRRYREGWFQGLREYFMCTAFRQKSDAASNCIGCGKCEKHCPQGIEIRKHLKDAQKVLEDPVYKTARWFAKTFMKF
jgi:predicted aldo/keto reductase-like oxidoreductase